MKILIIVIVNVLALNYNCYVGHAVPLNDEEVSILESKIKQNIIEDLYDNLNDNDLDDEDDAEFDTDDPYPVNGITGENENIISFQDDDGKWHIINLNDTLEPDYLYDYENLSWVDEPEFDVNSESEAMLPGRIWPFPSHVGDHVTPSLYSKDDPETGYDLNTVNGRDAPFDINHPTKVIVHGWLESGGKMWVKRMKDKYFINGYHNIVIVDWQRYAVLGYATSSRKTRKIGAYLGQVLISLIVADKIHIEDIHLVAHSLGAHIAGVAAKTIYKQLGKKVGRITGLDPAGPLFESPFLVRKKKRLVKEDADYVDIIHTCGGGLGFRRAFGHSDFFPNKGKPIQPGCGIFKNIICSHARGYQYFTESVNSERFLSTPCTSWKNFKNGKCDGAERVSMGYYLDTSKANGKYYLHTRRRKPFAKG